MPISISIYAHLKEFLLKLQIQYRTFKKKGCLHGLLRGSGGRRGHKIWIGNNLQISNPLLKPHRYLTYFDHLQKYANMHIRIYNYILLYNKGVPINITKSADLKQFFFSNYQYNLWHFWKKKSGCLHGLRRGSGDRRAQKKEQKSLSLSPVKSNHYKYSLPSFFENLTPSNLKESHWFESCPFQSR